MKLEEEDSLKGCTRGFHSVDKRREESKRGNILVTSDLTNGVNHSLGRFPPKQPMARGTLNVQSTLLTASLSPRRRLLVAFLLPPQRHPLEHLPFSSQTNVGGACSVYR